MDNSTLDLEMQEEDMEDDLIDQQDAFIEGQEEEIDIILLGEDPKMAKKK